MNRTGPSIDRIMNFVAVVLSLRAPASIAAIAAGTGYSRANTHRLIERMQRFFPLEVRHGRGHGHDTIVNLRRCP